MICSNCNTEKESSEFYKGQKQCKECYKEKRRKRYEKGKEAKLDNITEVDFSNNFNETDEVKESINFDGFGNDLMSGMLADTLKQVFKLIATRAGKHWVIDNDEAISLSKPTINLISKSKFYSTLMDNADIVSLATACTFIIAPRVMKTVKNGNIDRGENLNDGNRKHTENRKTNIRTEKTETKTENNYDDIINEITDNVYGDNETINF